MRVPHIRFSVRRLILAVTFLAVLLGGEAMRRRRAACLVRLAWLTGLERTLATSRPEDERVVSSPQLKRGKQMGAAEALREIARQKRLYEYAASHPWSPAPPDSE